MLDRFTYWLADLLFSKHLEEDYGNGIQEGRARTRMATIVMLKRLIEDSPKYYRPGLELALREFQRRA